MTNSDLFLLFAIIAVILLLAIPPSYTAKLRPELKLKSGEKLKWWQGAGWLLFVPDELYTEKGVLIKYRARKLWTACIVSFMIFPPLLIVASMLLQS